MRIDLPLQILYEKLPSKEIGYYFYRLLAGSITMFILFALMAPNDSSDLVVGLMSAVFLVVVGGLFFLTLLVVLYTKQGRMLDWCGTYFPAAAASSNIQSAFSVVGEVFRIVLMIYLYVLGLGVVVGAIDIVYAVVLG